MTLELEIQDITLNNPAKAPEGYKWSELGIIPEEWDVQRLADFTPFVTSGSRGWARYYSDQGAAFLRITNLSRESIYIDLSDLKLVELPPNNTEGQRTQLQNGDLLVSITADIGIIGYVNHLVPKPAYINQHIALVRLHQDKVDSKFLSYYIASATSQRIFKAMADQGAKAGMNLKAVLAISAVIPPLPEQRAIAAALSDVDALIEALEKLIAKKRDIKLATMQQLLTGKTRLPGFSGEWEVKRLGDICTIAMGRTPSRKIAAFWGSGHIWLSISDLQGKVVSNSKEQITDLAASQMTPIPKGTLLMSFKLTIGKLCFAGCNLFTNEAICSFTNLKANANYLYYALGQTDFSLYGKQAVKGYTLNSKSLETVEVILPEPKEQQAIASILSDMDAEIEALEQRLEKTKQIKQGMMQQLLTGRVRLV